MASANNNFDGVFQSLVKNRTMEECEDIKNENLAVTDSSNLIIKAKFDRELVEYDDQHQGSHRKAWTSERILDVINDIKKAQVAMSSGQRRTAMDYYWMGKYDIMTTVNEVYLIFKRLTATAPTVRILPREQYFDILLDVHKSSGHGGRDRILHDIKNRYYIPKKAVELFVSLCPICETKRNAPRKGIVTKPIVSCDFNLQGQVDLTDFQSCPDGEFKWLLNYQDNATKFLNLRPLKTKTAVEVASELMKIFLTFGAPYTLQSDNGREFTANVIKELVAMWPKCKIVLGNLHGSPQAQGSVERSNQDVENMLRTWMNENKSTNWSVGCFFVQYFKNASFHRIIGRSPYQALFGSEPKGQVEQDLNLERDKAHKGLKRAAENMIDTTVKIMPKLEIDSSVLVSITKEDCGPLDMKNVQGKIDDIKNGFYNVGTKYGTIKNWFSRQDLQYSDTDYGEEISENLISLREAVASQSPSGGQGFQKCNCKPAVNQCRNNKCTCFKNKVLCGSKCHGSLTCVNK